MKKKSKNKVAINYNNFVNNFYQNSNDKQNEVVYE